MLKPLNKLMMEGFDDDYVLLYPNPLPQLLNDGIEEGWIVPIPKEHTCHHNKETLDDSYIYRCPICGDVKPYCPSNEND